MAVVAILIFAHSLSWAQLEPTVDWVYSADGCESCTLQQVSVMQRYFQPGDRIFLNYPSRNKTLAKQLAADFSKKFPDVTILKKETRFRGIVTGWVLHDPVTKEEVIYQTRREKYGVLRAQTILEVFRDPNP